MERLHATGALTRRACEHAYEGLYLAAVTTFEGFVEDLFIGLLLSAGGLRSNLAGVRARVSFRSYPVARQVVYGVGSNYADWLPFEKTERRAKVFFRKGRPFHHLSASTSDPAAKQARELLNRAILIRNAIAHRSRFSLRRFEQEVLRDLPLPAAEKRPAGFLRGLSQATPPVTRFEAYTGALMQAARRLAG